MEHMSVVRFEIRRYLMIRHVWNGGWENHSSQKIRLGLGKAVNARLLCILVIRFSYVQSQNRRHHTQSTLTFASYLLLVVSSSLEFPPF
jgi:hypothetical protein